MQKPDEARFTFEQNPALVESTRDSKPGDKLEYKVLCTLKAKDDEGIDVIVEAVIPPGYELDKDSDGRDTPATGAMAGEPTMMTPTAMMVRRKKNAKGY